MTELKIEIVPLAEAPWAPELTGGRWGWRILDAGTTCATGASIERSKGIVEATVKKAAKRIEAARSGAPFGNFVRGRRAAALDD